jgi:cytidylate kinase
MPSAAPPAMLIVSGPPGAGKTTIARRMAEASNTPAVHLHTDNFFEAIRSGFIAPWLPQSAPQNTTISRVIVAAAGAYAQGGYRVLVDGVVGPWFLEIHRTEAARIGVALDYVVLRPALEIAVVRARDRHVGPLADYPPNIFEGFANLGALENHVIDNSAVAESEVIARIEAGLATGRFRLA